MNGLYVLIGLSIACMLLGWLLGIKSPWGHALNRASDGLFFLIVLLFLVSNVRRPKFIREFFYGPERELSDDEKVAEARRDLTNKELETLKRPVEWAFSVSYFTSMMIAVQWWFIDEFPMAILLGIALTALVTIAGLILWGQHRITVYFRDHH